MPDLEARLLAAHQDPDPSVLSVLYTEAADMREAEGNIPATCFFLTHAYVYALQAGLAGAHELQHRLWQYGAEDQPKGYPL